MINDNSCTFNCCVSCDLILQRIDKGLDWNIFDAVLLDLFKWKIRFSLLVFQAEHHLVILVLDEMAVLMIHRLLLGAKT